MLNKFKFHVFSLLSIVLLMHIIFKPSPVFAQNNTDNSELSDYNNTKYEIVDIKYDILGLVTIAALKNKIGFQKNVFFDSLTDLNRYVEDKRELLLSQRVLTNTLSTVSYVVNWNEEKKQYDVTLLVYVSVGSSILILPYPKYSTDDGLSLTGRIRNYNFLGSLDTLAINLDWSTKQQTSGDFENKISTSIGMSYPWSFSNHNLVLDLEEYLEYKFLASEFKNTVSVGLNYSVPLHQQLRYNASLNIKNISEILDTISDFNYVELKLKYFSLNWQINKVPLKQGANVFYDFYSEYRQDIPVYSSFFLKDANGNITNKKNTVVFHDEQPNQNDPNSTRLNAYPKIGQSLGIGNISTVKGSFFRKGYDIRLSNDYLYNIRYGLYSDSPNYTKLNPQEGWEIDVSTTAELHLLLWNFLSINFRGYGFLHTYFESSKLDTTDWGSNLDSYLRGVLYEQFGNAYRGFVLNTDILFRLGQIRINRIFSAEFHMGPIVDFGIRKTYYDFNSDSDIKITAGLEGIAHHLYLNGIRIRGSFAVDLTQVLWDINNTDASTLSSIWQNKEIYIGTELFY